jgi:hypothetical protein
MCRPFSKKTASQIFEAQRRAQLGVVAQARMRVQRQVRTVNGQIILDQQFEHFPAPAGPGNGRTPEQSVMHDHQIGPAAMASLIVASEASTQAAMRPPGPSFPPAIR